MMHLLTQFILAIFATGGFCLIFRVPLRHIPVCMAIGGLGWVTYEISMYYYASPSIGCFFGACNVGLLSTIASRMFKDASTIFVIPGILCLVPGSAIFNTMAALLRDDFSSAMDVGMQTLLMAGAIAFGLLVIGAVIRVFFALMRKTVMLRDKF